MCRKDPGSPCCATTAGGRVIEDEGLHVGREVVQACRRRDKKDCPAVPRASIAEARLPRRGWPWRCCKSRRGRRPLARWDISGPPRLSSKWCFSRLVSSIFSCVYSSNIPSLTHSSITMHLALFCTLLLLLSLPPAIGQNASWTACWFGDIDSACEGAETGCTPDGMLVGVSLFLLTGLPPVWSPSPDR